MKTLNYDVIVIGTGIAGLTTAIKLSENENLNIAIITRGKKPEESNTYWAQGGIIYINKDDQYLSNDVQAASQNTSYQPAIDQLINDSSDIVKEILIEGAETQFAKDELGELKLTQEAAHSIPRILYNGDATGKAIEVSLLNYLSTLKNVDIQTEKTAIDLITPSHHGVEIQQRYEENKVVGVYVFDQRNSEVDKYMAKRVVLATGGIGSLYLHHSNSEAARGDGHAMAKRAGATLTNMEYIQFHPTTYFGSSSDRRFLISEAVRGEGGKLVDKHGNRFMEKYHPDAEMAPRDVVSKAIITEMVDNKWDCVFLDITDKDRDWLEERFPNIFKYLIDRKIDMSRDLIPVVPAAHYTCGGIKTDLRGRTNLKYLYAVGEVACTGLHGVNRLASTSLLEGLTWGYKAAEDILKTIPTHGNFYNSELIQNWKLSSDELDLALINQDIAIIKQTMWNYVGIKRSKNRLHRANAMISELYEQVQKFYRNAQLHDQLIGLRNSIEIAFVVLSASLRRSE